MATLYIMRHGQAERSASHDSERALTEAGQTEVRASAQHWPTQSDLFLASPYVRAQQTALLAAQTSGLSTPLLTLDLLTPSGLPSRVDQWLSEQQWNVAVIVSHQPLVGMLVEYFSDKDCRQFPTAGLARIEAQVMGKGCGRFEWLNCD